ncbi:hypothetical protein [Nonomuraea aurantiaca]|uniref:hypothetical protein n=1 Tax=Nonomuraea aurantiaca TaxID=2878562 RepID=UPI001CD9CD92|nr:hypothetical protein [Nonomuraea aurantiaca]MCA2227384.1 hypothetical protein [Nonomuraea aurantiaca]
MLSIRLTGTPAEVADAVLTLRETFCIAAIKGLCPSAPAQPSVRVYVEVAPG